MGRLHSKGERMVEMRPLTYILIACLLGLCAALAYAATFPLIKVDCGSLAGSGTVYIKVDENTYRYNFSCGTEA